MKSLYLIRHAKSSRESPYTGDFERPLNNQGIKDAPLMATMLEKKCVHPDFVISSPAIRAITTAKLFCDILSYPHVRIQQRSEIYNGRASQLLNIVQQIPDNCKTAMLFGHNPTITEFAILLIGKHIESMPTCGIVQINFDFTLWQDVAPDKGKKVWYEYPRKSLE